HPQVRLVELLVEHADSVGDRVELPRQAPGLGLLLGDGGGPGRGRGEERDEGSDRDERRAQPPSVMWGHAASLLTGLRALPPGVPPGCEQVHNAAGEGSAGDLPEATTR